MTKTRHVAILAPSRTEDGIGSTLKVQHRIYESVLEILVNLELSRLQRSRRPIRCGRLQPVVQKLRVVKLSLDVLPRGKESLCHPGTRFNSLEKQLSKL